LNQLAIKKILLVDKNKLTEALMRKPAALVTHKEIPVQEAHLFQGNTYLRAMKAKKH